MCNARRPSGTARSVSFTESSEKMARIQSNDTGDPTTHFGQTQFRVMAEN